MRALSLALLLALGTALAQSPTAQLLESARAWEAQQRPDLARLALEKLLAAEPGHPEASLRLGELEIRSGNLEAVERVLDALRERHPGHPATRELAETLRVYTRDRLALANLRRLTETGRDAEAADAARALYPQGPPPGVLGLEYWQVLANNPADRAEAEAGLAEFAARYPQDPRYAAELARLRASKNAAQREQARLAQNDAQAVRSGWLQRRAARHTVLLQEAEQAQARQRGGETRRKLEEAHALVPEDPWTRYRLARLYAELGQREEAKNLMREGVLRAPKDADARYASALLLGSLDDYTTALDVLREIPPAQRSTGMRQLERRLHVSLAREQAARLQAEGRAGDAAAALTAAENWAGDDAELRAALADRWLSLDQPARALDPLRPLIGANADADLRLRWAGLLNRAARDEELGSVLTTLESMPLDTAQRTRVARLRREQSLRQLAQLRERGDTDAAHRAAQALLASTPEEDLATRGDLVRELLDLGELVEAQQLAERMRTQAPTDPQAWVALGRVARAQHQPRRAAAHFREALTLEARQATPPDYSAAAQQLQFMDERREGFIAAAPGYYDKPGSAGRSSYRAEQLTLEARVPLGYDGHFFAVADFVRADAGTLPAVYDEAALYGSVQAVGPGALAQFPNGSPQDAQGVDIGLGWQGERLRVDLGSTPLGFAVENWVGGLRWSDRAGVLDYRVELTRRAVTGSLISYAGAVDPASGRVWGGVVSSGGQLRLGWDRGRLSTSATLGAYRLTGRNVPDNDHTALRLAGDWRFIDTGNMRVDAGLALTHWTYAENLGEYTFGHGGYYSPQRYLSLSLPVDWSGRHARWAWQLRGALSLSDTEIDPQVFYPGDAALQAQAGLSPLPAGFAQPVYGAGGGSGSGVSLRGAVEYQLTPEWYVGTVVDLDRSEFYTPNSYGLYLRHDFDGRPTRIGFPPRPPQPYVNY